MCPTSSATIPKRPGPKKNGTVVPLLETLHGIADRTITTDALLTQRKLAACPRKRGARYLFTVKANQPILLDDIRTLFDEVTAQRVPDFVDESPKPEHGRRERRSIRGSSECNDDADFPGIGQVFVVQRDIRQVKSGRKSCETACGVASPTPQDASPQRLLNSAVRASQSEAENQNKFAVAFPRRTLTLSRQNMPASWDPPHILRAFSAKRTEKCKVLSDLSTPVWHRMFRSLAPK